MTVTKGIYQKGSVKLLTAVSWLDGTEVNVAVPVAEEFCADGSPWPGTEQERDQWACRVEQAPPVFDSEDEAARFERNLADARHELLRGQSQQAERMERIARSFD